MQALSGSGTSCHLAKQAWPWSTAMGLRTDWKWGGWTHPWTTTERGRKEMFNGRTGDGPKVGAASALPFLCSSVTRKGEQRHASLAQSL